MPPFQDHPDGGLSSRCDHLEAAPVHRWSNGRTAIDVRASDRRALSPPWRKPYGTVDVGVRVCCVLDGVPCCPGVAGEASRLGMGDTKLRGGTDFVGQPRPP